MFVPSTSDPQYYRSPLSPGQCRMIALAMLAGSTLFVVIALALPLIGADSPSDGPATSPLPHLSVVNAILIATTFAVASIVRLRCTSSGPGLRFWIVRWALLESAALFGGILVLLAGLEGTVPQDPPYYLNLGGYAVLVVSLVLDLLTGFESDSAERRATHLR